MTTRVSVTERGTRRQTSPLVPHRRLGGRPPEEAQGTGGSLTGGRSQLRLSPTALHPGTLGVSCHPSSLQRGVRLLRAPWSRPRRKHRLSKRGCVLPSPDPGAQPAPAPGDARRRGGRPPGGPANRASVSRPPPPQPPIVPKVCGEGDTSNFEAYPDNDWNTAPSVSPKDLEVFKNF